MANLTIKTIEEWRANEPSSRYMQALRDKGFRVKLKVLDGGDVAADYFIISHPNWDYYVDAKTFFLRRPYIKTKSRKIELHGSCFRYQCHIYADRGVSVPDIQLAAELYEQIHNWGTSSWKIIFD